MDNDDFAYILSFLFIYSPFLIAVSVMVSTLQSNTMMEEYENNMKIIIVLFGGLIASGFLSHHFYEVIGKWFKIYSDY